MIHLPPFPRLALALAALLSLAGCATQSTIAELKPLQHETYWELVDDPAATAPATTAATNFDLHPNISDSIKNPWPITTAPATNRTIILDESKWTQASSQPATIASTEPDTIPYSFDKHFPETAPAPATTSADLQLNGVSQTLQGGLASSTTTAPATTRPAPPIETPLIFHGEVPPPAPPGKKYVQRERIVDPNQSERFAYRVNYDFLWQHAIQTLSDMGYTVDRRDYRLGVIITNPEYSANIIEPWRRDQTSITSAAENTLHAQRRMIRITIQKAPNPAFYEVGIQVLIDREINPRESIGEFESFRGSSPGFGRETKTLRSDYIGITDIPKDAAAATHPAAPTPATHPKTDWIPVGRDPALEQKLLTQLFSQL